MVWGSNGWGAFLHLNGAGPRVSAPEKEVPPAVVLARTELAGLSSASTAASADPNEGEFRAINPSAARIETVVTEAGEARKKARKDGPWVQIS